MKRTEFKKLVKETMRECVYEVLIESGAVANIVTEVMKGINVAPVIVEARDSRLDPIGPASQIDELEEVDELPPNTQIGRDTGPDAAQRRKLEKLRKDMLDAVGQGAYNGVNLFEGTTPAPAAADPSTAAANPLSGMDPNDEGVDISGIMEVGGKNWKALMEGKGK